MIFAKPVFLCLTGGTCASQEGTCASQGSNYGSVFCTFASYKETIAKPGENLYFRVHFTKIVPHKIFCGWHSDGRIPALSDSLPPPSARPGPGMAHRLVAYTPTANLPFIMVSTQNCLAL